MSVKQLLQYTLQRNAQRRHRRCGTCRGVRVLCTQCARMWCVSCHPTGCPYPHPTTETTSTTPPPTDTVQRSTEEPPTPPPLTIAIPHKRTPKPIKIDKRKGPRMKSVPVPPVLETFVKDVTALGYQITAIVPADTNLYVKGVWQVTVWVPNPIVPLGGDRFPDGGRRLVNFTRVTKARGTEISITLG